MTPKKALMIISKMCFLISDKADEIKFRGFFAALKTAIEALKKQIPKKPRKNEYGFYMCSSCRADDYALMHDSNLANRYNHCNNCGQALDWGDTK